MNLKEKYLESKKILEIDNFVLTDLIHLADTLSDLINSLDSEIISAIEKREENEE